jgi:hypothetical protein
MDYLLRRFYWMLTRLFWVKVGKSTHMNSTYMCMASPSLSRSTRQWSHFCPASTSRQSSCDYESSRFCKLWHIHYTFVAGPFAALKLGCRLQKAACKKFPPCPQLTTLSVHNFSIAQTMSSTWPSLLLSNFSIFFCGVYVFSVL